MDRNSEQHYAELDAIETPRSSWERDFNHKTSFNAGKLIPFYVNMDIIPGTTIKNQTSVVIRMATPLYPVMDNLYLDTFYFKCSKFWYWEHWRAMMGENDHGAWVQEIEYEEPKIKTTSSRPSTVDDMMTYMGVPLAINGLEYSKMAVNAYIDIWNNWFRDQNLQAPVIFDKTDADLTVDGTINTGCGLLPVAKFHDYFTSCLPQPQKGEAVAMPLGLKAPVMTGEPHEFNNIITNKHMTMATNPNQPFDPQQAHALFVRGDKLGSIGGNANSTGLTQPNLKFDNLYADLSQATASTINALRLAYATQRILEVDSTMGTRYREILRSHFGSIASDESLNMPEYLGGKRIPINIQTVLQQSATNDTSPLGQTGGVSITTDVNDDFTKSFSKDDMLIGVMCVRADHTYQQGLARQFTRKRRLDRYWPELAHIGNQPVYNYEIFAQGNSQDNEVFGYKEAWQEYLYSNNRISGEMLSQYDKSLDAWHYGDDYASLPVLSDEWIKEPVENIDRTLAVQSTKSHQFWADILVTQKVTAPIPLNRTPGISNHY